MITCRELIDFLIDYVDGALPADQRSLFEAHLGVCPECVAYVRDYRATMQLGRAACCSSEDPAVSSAMPEGLVRAILAARR